MISKNNNKEKKQKGQLIIKSPLGDLFAVATEAGICSISFEKNVNYTEEPFQSNKLADDYLHNLQIQLDEYFRKERKEFHLPLDPIGTSFQKTVWMSLLEIPFGKTKTYIQQAKTLGNPLSIRAVAHANGKNPMAVVIPCHRVIGSRGELTGYAGGLWRKQWLLEHEQHVTGQMMIEGFRHTGM